jgi:hypothetical protein
MTNGLALSKAILSSNKIMASSFTFRLFLFPLQPLTVVFLNFASLGNPTSRI